MKTSTTQSSLCCVCRARPRDGFLFCKTCRRQWKRAADGTEASSITWAAKRAWFYARKANK